jgi:TRAP-type C4-dicarboxylate transport system substrate-binding protein
LTIVSGQTWGSVSDEDKQVFTAVLTEAADRCAQDIIKKQDEVAAWFEQQGVKVAKVDREPFRTAVLKLHNGPAATWDQATYDKLQAIR